MSLNLFGDGFCGLGLGDASGFTVSVAIFRFATSVAAISHTR